jgi:predicted MFS family arabinose efflux permease
MMGYVQLLRRNPRFVRLWMAQAVSLLGDWFSTIALSSLVSRFTGGSGLALSGLILARFIPPLFVGPFAGVLVDRLNRKHLLIFSDVLRAVVVLMFLFVSRPDTLWLLYLLTIIQFSLSSIFEPSQSAILPSLVVADDLILANTLGSVTWSVMLALGAVIGGLVTAVVGTTLALLIDASTFVVSALLISSIQVNAIPGKSSHVEHAHHERGFIDGLRYILRRPVLALTLLIKAGGNVGNIDLFMIIYATQFFIVGENGSGALGLLYSAFGFGAFIGPVVLNRVNNRSISRMRSLVSIGYLWIVFGWIIFGGAPTLFVAALGIILKAMGSAVYWTFSSVIIQKSVPDEFLGRVFSIDLFFFRLATAFSTVITGWLVDRAGFLSGITLSTAYKFLMTNTLQYSPSDNNIRTIVFGTGIASLLPLIIWSLLLPYMNRADARTNAKTS